MAHRILLTGANGFIAQHILTQLLEAGHSVRAVVRNQPKADQLLSTFASYPSTQLDTALVPDITTPGAFDAALASNRPFDAVLHTASPFNYRVVSSNLDFIDPAIKGTTEILSGIARVAPSVKRVVMTSSMAAVINWFLPKQTDPAKIYTEADWNPITWDEAVSTKVLNLAYGASKKFAEEAAWDFVAKKNPGFDLVIINPPMVYGPLADPNTYKSPQALNQSNFNLWRNFLDPGLTSASPVPPEGLHLYVDVRDVARAHVLSVVTPEAGGKRFVIGNGGVSNQKIANLFREALPKLADRIPEGEPDNAELPKGLFKVDSSLIQKVLGLKYTSIEDTFKQVAVQLAHIDELAQKTA
ncbi:NAD-dependent epimerase dehydratase [Colletotrichum truncatum]|uniref:NAD-dependent epimerase dehydratase n=1 Tax=Colletotrichum truncatum TaxID=5467 RepID=A0ACC3Z725_COLTU|nr:NAD-dependent epimerase dehydratase [Colletotrichum truncatum]KAF6787945.1 NAD-dependent epimerase dehydratase [Colletotrichum truncatum]